MKSHAALCAEIAERSISTNPTGHVRLRHTQAICDSIAQKPTRELRSSPESVERAAFEQQAPASAATALIGDYIDYAADGVGPIERRPGAAHHFDPAGVREQQVLNQP